MEKQNFITTLKVNDRLAYDAIKDLMKSKKITTLDTSNQNMEFDNLHVYAYDDENPCANVITITKIVLTNDSLEFFTYNGCCYTQFDLHEGSMPYIYDVVYDIIESNFNDPNLSEYEVILYYHGSICRNVMAIDENNALEIARAEIDKMSDKDFLNGIDIFEEGNDVRNVNNNEK